MFELSHPERLHILNMLKDEPMRLSQLSKKLKITTAEVSRHLDRLGNARLINRDSSSNYSITPFAAIVITEVTKFDFLLKNLDFFINHNLSTIPVYLQRFSSMSKGYFIEGTLETSSMIKDTSIEAQEYINIISDQVMRGMIELDSKKNDEGVVYKKIYPKDAEIPEEYKARMGENFQIKTLEEIPLSLKMNERIAGVALRGINGKIDYSMGLVGEDESFRIWVHSIFDYFWSHAKSVI
jgi:predicted transcriptional regulator